MVKPQIENIQSLEEKNKKIEEIKKIVAEKRQSLINENSWLK